MTELKVFLKLLHILVAAAVCLWVRLKILPFVKERGGSLGRYDASHQPPTVGNQSLFHGRRSNL